MKISSRTFRVDSLQELFCILEFVVKLFIDMQAKAWIHTIKNEKYNINKSKVNKNTYFHLQILYKGYRIVKNIIFGWILYKNL